MPLLGAIGNASKTAFSGNYDSRPFNLGLVDLVDAKPGQVYFSQLKKIEGINYKVPISISGDGEYFLSSKFDKTFDSNKLSYDNIDEVYNNQFPNIVLDRTNIFTERSDKTLDSISNTIDSSVISFDEVDNVVSLITDGSVYKSTPGTVRSGDFISLRIFSTTPVLLENFFDVIPRSGIPYNYAIYSTFDIDLRQGTYTFDSNNILEYNDRPYQGFDLTPDYFGKTYSTTISIGSSSFTWNVTTKNAGSAENLSFNDVIGAFLSDEIISSNYTVSGLTDIFDYNAEVTTIEGFLSVNYGPFVKSSPIQNGDILRLQLNSSATENTAKSISLKTYYTEFVGVAETTWTATTLKLTPTNLTFDNVVSAELKTDIISNEIVIDGLSDGIDYRIITTNSEQAISVNGANYASEFVIRNGDNIKLKITTSSIWEETKSITVALGLPNEPTSSYYQTTWSVKNREILVNSDPNSSLLIYAIPFERKHLFKDLSPEIRTSSGLTSGLRANVSRPTYYNFYPDISDQDSRYYLDSLKLAQGSSTSSFQTTFVSTVVDNVQTLGTNNFTLEFWIKSSAYGFNGSVGMSILYPTYLDSLNSNDYMIQFFLKGDNWPNSYSFKRGFLVGYPQSNGSVTTICETTSRVLGSNTWQHVALVRNGNTFVVYVDGIARTSGSASLNLTSKNFYQFIPNFQRLTSDNMFIQDIRLYRGLAKYTSNYNVSTVGSILEQYSP